MFRRLRDRMNDAVSNAASSVSNTSFSDDRVSELASMGFREAEARHALRLANGDMAQATEWLLSNGSPLGAAGNPITIPESRATTTTSAPMSQEDKELQRAIQASLQTQQSTNKNTTKQPRQQSAASRNAGLAAASRNQNKNSARKKSLATTHPKVQMPKRLSQHDQEDIIMRCTSRVAPYSLAVDTLLRSLKTIQANSSNRKFHTVDTTTAMFQRSLNAPGVLDFLKAVNFHPNYNNQKTLTLSHFDAAAFYLGISALEQVQQNSPEYTKDKTLRLFQKDLSSALSGTGNADEEMSARRNFLSKLPSEPTKGGSQITVEYGVILNNATAENNNNEKAPQSLTRITRGFDHDDTLGDVVHWLGGQASAIPGKLERGEWRLVDRNRQGAEEDYNFHRLDLEELRDRTLQYVGCWPSGRLAIVPKLAL
eukprot:CAMPEP_0172376450 /NCGR_PEP_ID=MMETSP1060-20121228/67038_1 /TAXON_ID=37318 /ORGANISM="Pseudo-nitzschia pungens, Strain cf. cingulata" /LENGTH=425 /DNA_ID=CAMNT_0013103973 /DNA_START=78 /DNA_END=1355 /DNA_ORIENTATION=-